jgi:adhesin transport system membrane fusion protein
MTVKDTARKDMPGKIRFPEPPDPSIRQDYGPAPPGPAQPAAGLQPAIVSAPDAGGASGGLADNDDRSSGPSSSIILVSAAFIAVAIGWASFAELDEVTRADGRVIPSSKTQIIQSSEPGVVQDILVRLGQRVEKGDVLIRLDDTTTASSLGESVARAQALKARIARLRIENAGDPAAGFACPEGVDADVCANEANLLAARHQSFLKSVSVFAERVQQRRRELAETRSNIDRLTESLGLAENELTLLEPLAKRRLVSQTDYIRAQRDVADLQGQIRTGAESVGRIEASLREAELQAQQVELQFRQEALSELTEHLAELAVLGQTIVGAEDRVSRTDIRSPVDGIVNNLAINTVGAFVTAGTAVVDIVPVDDKLLVEARVRPSDIAFIRPGQAATVKVTAYDFSIYGGVDGIVDQVSPDSVLDPETRETFYTVLVRTDIAELERDGQTFPILPGMVTQVDILTGKKTILQYLLKPVNKAREEALRER